MSAWEEAIAIKARSMTDDELLRTMRKAMQNLQTAARNFRG